MFLFRHSPAHAHCRAQRGRASSTALWLWLHSSTRLWPATTAQLRLWHVNTQKLPAPPPHHHYNLTQHSPVICPFLFVFLTSFPWSSTHNRGHKQATTHSHFEYYFFTMSCYKRKHLTTLKDFYLYCLKRNWTTCLFFTFHIYDYLFRFFLFILLSCFFFIGLWFVQKWTC